MPGVIRSLGTNSRIPRFGQKVRMLTYLALSQPGSGKVYTGTTYYITPGANPANTGLAEGEALPPESLADILANENGPFNVLFQRGNTYELETNVLQTYAGTDTDNRVRFGAYGDGPRPIILGSRNIAAPNQLWQQASPGLWTLDIDLPGVGMLVVDGEMSYPCSSDLFTIGSATKVEIASPSLAAKDYTGAYCNHRGSKWAGETRPIAAHSGETISFADDAKSGTGNNGNGFYILNHPDFLTEAGDWYYDEDAKRLYMRTNGPAPAGDIRAPQKEFGFQIKGRFVEIADLSFRYIYKDAVRVEEADLSIDYCDFAWCYNSAVFTTSADRLKINRCSVSHISGVGIYLENADNVEIDDTDISFIANLAWGRSTGVIGAGGAAHNHWATGITFRASCSDGRVRNCIVHDCGYNGIRTDGPRHIVEDCYIYDTLLQLADGGGLYCFDNNQTEASDRLTEEVIWRR
ncbi:MAG: right-handed parallel beta-helix repeat-containing protein, partial [Bacteroidota bacterium]